RYAPVDISPRIAEAIGVKPGRYAINSWGHQNMSRPMAGIEPTINGIPRRECFGDLLVEVAPPFELGNNLLYFKHDGN
ncbi:MAG: hypothetical protein AAB834_07815, partial [Patescibacteria group bacterium]